jgi:hypothetical protein
MVWTAAWSPDADVLFKDTGAGRERLSRFLYLSNTYTTSLTVLLVCSNLHFTWRVPSCFPLS